MLTATLVGDPAGVLEFFAPLLTFLDLQLAKVKDWAGMRAATAAMIDAGPKAGLSKRHTARLRRYVHVLQLIETMSHSEAWMARKHAQVGAKLERYEQMDGDERRSLERDVDQFERQVGTNRKRRQEIRRELAPTTARWRGTARRPRRSRRSQRRVPARQVQLNSGGAGARDADGDSDGEPPPGECGYASRFRFAGFAAIRFAALRRDSEWGAA